MSDVKKHVDPIPDEFASCEEAAEFWDSHDTLDYPGAFRSVEVETEFRGRHVEEVLTIRLPGEIRHMLNRTSEELARDIRLYAALMLFRLNKLSSGAAAEMAGVPRVLFLDLCAEYDIPVSQITGDDLSREMTSA